MSASNKTWLFKQKHMKNTVIMESQKKVELHCRAQPGSDRRWLGGGGGWAFKIFIMAYSGLRTSCVYTVLLLIATVPPLWNKWRLQNQTHFTNTMYKFHFLFFFSSLASRFCHCTSIIPHTPIYRAFKLTNSYLQIYLVKPWLISTVFKTNLATI